MNGCCDRTWTKIFGIEEWTVMIVITDQQWTGYNNVNMMDSKWLHRCLLAKVDSKQQNKSKRAKYVLNVSMIIVLLGSRYNFLKVECFGFLISHWRSYFLRALPKKKLPKTILREHFILGRHCSKTISSVGFDCINILSCFYSRCI